MIANRASALARVRRGRPAFAVDPFVPDNSFKVWNI
jgi:hypothetical protein